MSDANAGTCTVIVAREGAVDPERDRRLLDAVGGRLGLGPGQVIRPDVMSAVEFRLVEGVDRRTADSVAAEAVRLGYAPRIRDRMGIKWSNQRGTGAFTTVFTLGALGIISVMGLLGSLGYELTVPVVGVVMMLLWMMVSLRWFRRQIYLPLVVPTEVVHALGSAVADQPLRDAVIEARRALGRLVGALSEDVPELAAADLQRTVASLRTKVDRLASEAEVLGEGAAEAPGLVVLRERRDQLVERGEAGAEIDRLDQVIDAEERAMDARVGRRVEVVAALMEVRRQALQAETLLRVGVDDEAPAAQLTEEAEALRRARLAASKRRVR